MNRPTLFTLFTALSVMCAALAVNNKIMQCENNYLETFSVKHSFQWKHSLHALKEQLNILEWMSFSV